MNDNVKPITPKTLRQEVEDELRAEQRTQAKVALKAQMAVVMRAERALAVERAKLDDLEAQIAEGTAG